MSDVTPPTLNFAEPDPASVEPVNVLLYGPAGSGKTVGACSAPGPVLVVNAEGPSALRFARHRFGHDHIREYPFKNSSTLREVEQYLTAGGNAEQTVVVDSVGEVYAALLQEVGGHQPQIQHYGKVNGELIRFIRFLRNLSLNVVLVAHEQIDDSEEGGAVRRPATGTKKNPEEVMKHMDVVAYCSPLVDEDDEGNTTVRYLGQLVQAKGRRAKDRSGALGVVRDLDLTEWAEAYHDALAQPVQDALPWSDAPDPALGDDGGLPPMDRADVVDQVALDVEAA